MRKTPSLQSQSKLRHTTHYENSFISVIIDTHLNSHWAKLCRNFGLTVTDRDGRNVNNFDSFWQALIFWNILSNIHVYAACCFQCLKMLLPPPQALDYSDFFRVWNRPFRRVVVVVMPIHEDYIVIATKYLPSSHLSNEGCIGTFLGRNGRARYAQSYSLSYNPDVFKNHVTFFIALYLFI